MTFKQSAKIIQDPLAGSLFGFSLIIRGYQTGDQAPSCTISALWKEVISALSFRRWDPARIKRKFCLQVCVYCKNAESAIISSRLQDQCDPSGERDSDQCDLSGELDSVKLEPNDSDDNDEQVRQRCGEFRLELENQNHILTRLILLSVHSRDPKTGHSKRDI